MRHIIIVCGLMLAIIDVMYGQSVEKIPIPVLKENQKVDRLLDAVLGVGKMDKSVDANKNQDVCYMIELFRGNDNSYSYQIKKVAKPVINILINQRLNRLDLGCFQYRSNYFFVWTNTDFSELITKSDKVITSDFVYKLQPIPNLKSPYDIKIWHYVYEKDHFAVEGGPPSIN